MRCVSRIGLILVTCRLELLLVFVFCLLEALSWDAVWALGQVIDLLMGLRYKYAY